MTDADRDQLILTLTCWAEARGEGLAGWAAQAHSVVNRHAAGHWYSRKTLAGTCLLAYQYSAENTTDPNRLEAAETPMDDPVMAGVAAAVAQAIAGDSNDPTQGSTHYYAAGTTVPAWADPATGSIFTVQIGRHLFFRNVA